MLAVCKKSISSPHKTGESAGAAAASATTTASTAVVAVD